MGAILDALHRLQEIERKLNTYRGKEESYRRQARTVNRQIAKGAADCEAHQAAVTRCQLEIDAVDLDIKSREEAMEKHRQALNAAKSNKEYAAILTALNTEKADAAKRESRVLELMGQKEEMQTKSAEFEKERQRLETRLKKHEDDLAAYQASIREDFERLEAERTAAAEALPPSALESFTRVAEKHEGEAMAEVIRLSVRADDFLCEGCNMSVPLETVNRLRSRDELMLCGTCGRLLYVDAAAVGT